MLGNTLVFFVMVGLGCVFAVTLNCDDGEVVLHGSCVPCPAGYKASNNLCNICDSNSVSPKGSTQCTACPPNSHADDRRENCVCDTNYYSYDVMPYHDDGPLHRRGEHLEDQIVVTDCFRCNGLCDVNTYSSGDECMSCPDGSISKVGSVSVADCKCLSGELYIDSMYSRCKPCASETFYNGGGPSSCTGCTAPKMSLLNCIGSYDDCCVDTQVFPCPIGTLPRDRGGSKCSSIGLRTDTELTEDEFGRILPMRRLEHGALENQRSLQNGYNVDDFTWKHSGYPLRKISRGEYSLCAQSLVTGNTFAVNSVQNVNLALAWNWQDDLVHKAVDGDAVRVVDFDCRWSTTENEANTFLAVPANSCLQSGNTQLYIFPHYLNGSVITDGIECGDYNMQVVSGLDFVCYFVYNPEVEMKCHGENAFLPSSTPMQSNTSTLISGPKDVCYWTSEIVKCWGLNWGPDADTVFRKPSFIVGHIKHVTVHYNDKSHMRICILYGSDFLQCVAGNFSGSDDGSVNSAFKDGLRYLYRTKITGITTGSIPRDLCIEVNHTTYECYDVFTNEKPGILGDESDPIEFDNQVDDWMDRNTRLVQNFVAWNPVIHLYPSLANSYDLDPGHSIVSPVFMRPYFSTPFYTLQEPNNSISMNERESFFESASTCPYLNKYCNRTRTLSDVKFDGNWTILGAGHTQPVGRLPLTSRIGLWVFVLRIRHDSQDYENIMDFDMLDVSLHAKQGAMKIFADALRKIDTSHSDGEFTHSQTGLVKTVVMIRVEREKISQIRLVSENMQEIAVTLHHNSSHFNFPALPDANEKLHIKQVLYYDNQVSIDAIWDIRGASFEDAFEKFSKKVVVAEKEFVSPTT